MAQNDAAYTSYAQFFKECNKSISVLWYWILKIEGTTDDHYRLKSWIEWKQEYAHCFTLLLLAL